MKDDHRLLMVGGLALVGSFFLVTKAAEGIAQARLNAQMHGPKQQRKSTAMDDVVKVIGVAFSFYTMIQQAPDLIEQANSLLSGE